MTAIGRCSRLPDADEVADAVRRAPVELTCRRRAVPARPASTANATRPITPAGNPARAPVSPVARASSSAVCTATESGSWPPGADGVNVFAPSATTSTHRFAALVDLRAQRPSARHRQRQLNDIG